MNTRRPAASRSARAYWLALLGIVAIAGTLRLWYVLRVSPPVEEMSDPWAYFLLGQNLAAGVGYIRPADFLFYRHLIPTAEFPPLFPTLLAALHFLGLSSIEVQKPLVAIMGVISVPLVAEIARRIRGPATGIVAALLTAFSPTLLESDGAFMTEVLCVPLVAASLLTALSADGRPLRWAFAGGLLGLAGLCRTEALLLVPLWVPVALWLESSMGRGRGIRLAGALIAGAALMVLPWTIRNYRALDAFVPISNSGSSAILGANCPQTYEGHLIGAWVYQCYEGVNTEGLSETARFARYREWGLAFARQHSQALPRVMAARLRRTFGLYEPAQILSSEGRTPAWSRPSMRVGLGVFAIALGGGAMLARRSLAVLALLGAPLLLAFLTSLLVYGNPRFRLLAEPSLLVLAAIALVQIARFAMAHLQKTPPGESSHRSESQS